MAKAKEHSRSRPGLEGQGWGPSDTSVRNQDLEYVKTGEEVCYRGGQATWVQVRRPDTKDRAEAASLLVAKLVPWLLQDSLNSCLTLKLEVFICGL